MNDISPKNSLSLHPDFFENARRSFVLDIAHGPDAVNEFEIARPVNYSVGCLRCVTTIPVVAAHDIPDVCRVFTHAASDHSDDAIIRRSCDRPGKLLTRIPSVKP